MTTIQFKFTWYDDAQTALHYIALGEWTWRDYHSCIQVSKYSLMNHPKHTVHSIIDFRHQTRAGMPAGLYAHLRSFGKQVVPAFSGHAIVIGLPDDAYASLPLDADDTLEAVNGRVYVVKNEDALQARLISLNQVK